MSGKRLTQDEIRDLALQRLFERLRLEDAEASVALSHPPDHDCELCQRVQSRLRARKGGAV